MILRVLFCLLALLAGALPAPAARADVSVVGSSQAIQTDYYSTSITVSVPAGLQAGDIVIAPVITRSGVNSYAPDSNWQLLQISGYTNVQEYGAVRQRFWWRTVPSGGLGASLTWTFDDYSRLHAGLVVLRGVNTSSPFGSSSTGTGTSSTATAASVTSTVNGSMRLAVFTGDNGNYGNAALSGSPAGVTLMWNNQTANTSNNNNGLATAAGYQLISTAGASGASSMTYTPSPRSWLGTSIIVNASATPPPTGSCSASFPDGVSTVNPGSYISINNNAVIAGSPDNIMDTPSISPNHFWSCWTGTCSADNSGVAALNPGAFQTTTSTTDLSGSFIQMTQADYDDITVATNGILGYSGGLTATTFHIDTLTANNGGLITLKAGTYWINSLFLDNNSVLQADGNVTLIVNSFSTDNGSNINYSGAGKIVLYSYGNIYLANNAIFKGVMYAAGQVYIDNNAWVIGAVTGGTRVILEHNSRVDYDSSIVNGANYGEICGATASVNHYRIEHPGNALTCVGATVTVKACANAACSSLYSGSSSVTLSPSGWDGGDNKTLSSGSVSAILRQAASGSVTLALPTTMPTASNPLVCVNGADNSNSCTLNFLSSGFVFDAPDVTANKASGSFVIKAVQTNVANPAQCVPTFQNKTRNIQFWSSYSAPNTGTLQTQLSNGSSTVTLDTAYNVSGSNLALAFNNNGEATVNFLRYADAGQVQLNARYIGSVANSDAGVDLSGNDLFISRPAGFCIEALTTGGAVLPACTSSACAVFQKAGRDFSLRVRAMAWEADGETNTQFCSGNSVTPNFSNSVSLTPAAQEVGYSNGQLLSGGVAFAAVTVNNGNITVPVAFSEVSRFTITGNSTYFSQAIPASASAAIGRITPDNFLVTVNSFPAACSASFSYAGLSGRAGQTATADITVRARNYQNNTTSNYQGVYNKFAANPLQFADFSGGVAAGDGQYVVPAHTLSFSSGIANSLLQTSYQFNNVRAPYSVSATVSATDADSITGSSSASATVDYRFGRLRLDNAYGPEQLPLRVPVQAEYWDGSRWQLNSADACSSYGPASAVAFSNWADALNAGETTVIGPASATLLIGGRHSSITPLQLSAPGTGNQGRVTLTHTTPSWLQFDWDGDGSHDDTATAVAQFGRYRGSDRVIDWRVD